MTRSLFSGLIFLALATLPAYAGSLLQPPADALRVEFVSPDTSPTERHKAGQSLTVGVVVTRSTGAVQVVPTSTPDWMTYDPKTREFSGIPVAGEHELSVRTTDTGTGQTATGILRFNIEAR
ncbi:hypothetical protein [Mycoplana rhizolycopersici]|uniref:Uncharacterized protein n=1 Tax=Mycoplana rhizolycopersici TaxID=2746702 RepID=A0ABX2QEE5_9HYPH|nr:MULTISPECIES: hypothetical protein [Rhizobium/Agrobacterium group]NVP54736.1 hypothetical protein [Rhizobium rhizolycopersici]TQN60078.1 hypothetical protein FLX27_17110 [Agrobacterium tumefaciens]